MEKILWSSRYALRAQGITSSIIREILKLTQRPEVISFAGGLPAAEYFPVQRFEQASQRVLEKDAARALQYSPTEGYPPLRELLAERLRREGMQVGIENVLITSGSQQALSLLGALLINPGDRVLVEEPTYLGAIQAFNTYQAQYIGVAADSDGVQADLLPSAMRQGPKFLYLLPNFQNPAGVTISAERRQTIVKLAAEWGTPIVEDDPYGSLRFEGEHIRSMIALDATLNGDPNAPYDGGVIYLSTFSKILAPGLRIAWMVGAPEVIAKLVQLKQGADLHTSTFAQMVIYETARDGFLDRHIQTLREVYRKRRDVMLEALERYMPDDVRWTHPQGGLFLWLHLPPEMDAMALFHAAVERNVAFVPGNAFFVGENPPPCARLNYSNMDEARIVEGIERLAQTIEALRNPTLTPAP